MRANPDGSLVRLRDVAEVELGGQSYAMQTRLDGRPAAGIGIQLAPGANALAAASGSRRSSPSSSARCPPTSA